MVRAIPSFGAFNTPAYSDITFQLLGYALEGIKGKSFQSMVEDGVLKPLGLNHTYYDTPPDSVGLIPGSYKDTNWGFRLGDGSP